LRYPHRRYFFVFCEINNEPVNSYISRHKSFEAALKAKYKHNQKPCPSNVYYEVYEFTQVHGYRKFC